MNRLQYILTILLFGLTLISFAQTEYSNEKSNEYKVLAKFISFEGGEKTHFAKFKVLKSLTNNLAVNDTVTVGYLNNKAPDKDIDNVLLTIKEYDERPATKNNFICPNYDGKTYIQKVKLEFIDFNYWENCELGKDECKALTFTRTKKDQKWYLIMPCGGTETAITISGKNFNEEIHLFHDDCPPLLKMTNLRDGNYFATMRADGLGGTVEFNLVTK